MEEASADDCVDMMLPAEFAVELNAFAFVIQCCQSVTSGAVTRKLLNLN